METKGLSLRQHIRKIVLVIFRKIEFVFVTFLVLVTSAFIFSRKIYSEITPPLFFRFCCRRFGPNVSILSTPYSQSAEQSTVTNQPLKDAEYICIQSSISSISGGEVREAFAGRKRKKLQVVACSPMHHAQTLFPFSQSSQEAIKAHNPLKILNFI